MARRAPAGALRLLFGAGICAVLRTAGQSKVKRRTLACTLWLGALYSYPVAPGFDGGRVVMAPVLFSVA